MTKEVRKIITIDEDKCNGCGICIPSCKEGALQIIDGKAKLISDVYCDGLGACLGTCPQDAIHIESREADAFDEKAVEEHLHDQAKAHNHSRPPATPCSCPSSHAQKVTPKESPNDSNQCSQLQNWPIQLHLLPPNAPYLAHSDIILLADCSAVAYANLHRDFIKDRIVVMACPKLDDTGPYAAKLAHIFQTQDINSLEVVIMEVPCCTGLIQIVKQGIADSKCNIEFTHTCIKLDGSRMDMQNTD